jgi:uncharacterized damage-inducible protein DinB
METLTYFKTMCRYNRWMNEKIYEVCATMPDEVRKRDCGAFFHSIHGTLNHLLLADRMWLGRFTQNPVSYPSLDHELYSDFEELRRERAKTDAAIESWIASLNEADLDEPLIFTPMSIGREMSFPLGHVALHFFNHQTHHRGQITTLMNQLGYDSGVTDLLRMPGLKLNMEKRT